MLVEMIRLYFWPFRAQVVLRHGPAVPTCVNEFSDGIISIRYIRRSSVLCPMNLAQIGIVLCPITQLFTTTI